MTKRIYVAYTGGTIGMQSSAQGYAPMPGFEALLRSRLHEQAQGVLPEFEVHEYPELIDSANLQPAHWTRIAEYIRARYDAFDGFVILHGTDTMAYTASALSFMLQGLDKPVIVTGSQIPLSELRNDALDNLITSLMLASSESLAEVCIYFNGRLLRGNRSTKLKATGFDAFDSPNYPWLGQVGIHIELHHDQLLDSGPRDFRVLDFNPLAVVPLRLYPGMPAALVDRVLADMSIGGLILETYGIGNAPDQNSGLMERLAAASDNGVVVVNLTQCLQGKVCQQSYATGVSLGRIGVISGADMTLEAAFAKLHYLLACGYSTEQTRELMARNLCGELS